ncbi:hypothetical protein [Pelagicoccus sp. SDUM812005]|uniref:hypothetical protein n=1 Tax=Pelagicoccus sp. SDUM812005 TaxID=3041257 RepID=UPI00280CEC21|nr:hypothetical protein [Pelagicoccus sp. SDUM812005]MDQ8183481.1 hypothetical protein [Pelagicoccus sp. SDUM812005]
MGSEQLYAYPDSLSRLIPWGGSLLMSGLLLYLVALSGKPTSQPELERQLQIAEAIVLPPPPDIREEPPTVETPPPPPQAFDFKAFRSQEAVALMDVKIEPEKDKDVLRQFDVRLNSESVTMEAVKESYVYERKEVDIIPEVVHRVMPEVRTNEKGGKVRIRLMFAVDEKGKVGQRYVLECTHPEVNEQVLKSLDSWVFFPARKGKRVVRCWVRQTIVINLGSGSPLSF